MRELHTATLAKSSSITSNVAVKTILVIPTDPHFVRDSLKRTHDSLGLTDFLFPDAKRVISELSHLNAVHDVFLLMADVRFAYEVPSLSDGWVEVFDVESGRSRVLSRREMRRLATRVGEWQDEIERLARDADLDLVRVGLDRWEMETTLVEFTAERRLRKM